jgi:hypothetical protein
LNRVHYFGLQSVLLHGAHGSNQQISVSATAALMVHIFLNVSIIAAFSGVIEFIFKKILKTISFFT